MEFTSLKQLYQKLLPAFAVKKRLISITKYKHINNEDIWQYLVKTKWSNSYNLQLSDIINDIITIEVDKVNTFLGGAKWKKQN